MKKDNNLKIHKQYLYVLPIILLSIIACCIGVKYNMVLFVLMTLIILFASVFTVILLIINYKKTELVITKLSSEEGSVVIKSALNGSFVPSVLCTAQGQVIAKNKMFTDIYTEMYLDKLFTEQELEYTEHTFEKTIGDSTYKINVSPVENKNSNVKNQVLFISLIDITELKAAQRDYQAIKPVYVRIFVDNYDDMSLENDITSISVLNQLEGKLLVLANDVVEGICRREMRSFILVFETAHLERFEGAVQQLLKESHDIRTSNDQPVTLSIGVGCGESIKLAAQRSAYAIEHAQNRGGDQCAILDNNDSVFKCYGEGIAKNQTTNSKVNASVKADLLKECILRSNDVYIMGHKDEDIDCIGGTFGLMAYIMKECKKRAFFVYSGTAAKLMDDIQMQLPDWMNGFVLTPDEAVAQQKKDDLLIILDVQNEFLLPAPELYRKLSDNVALIDHHRPGNQPVKGTCLSYTSHFSSSTCELITEMLQILCKERKTISKFEATALLAGIAMDSKGFIFNTARRTYEAAAFLKKRGADTLDAMRMYQDDKSRYEVISHIVTTATVNNRIAISVCEGGVQNERVVAARSADVLVMIKGVAASFVLIKTGANVLISARSTGEINVQRICEGLGGGGHMRSAGATLRDVDCNEAVDLLTKTIDKYFASIEESKQ